MVIMGVAARASTDAFYCEYQSVAPFIVCVGGFLSSCGLLLCTYFVWSATGRWFHKFIIVSIMTVFVILCMASAIAIFFSFVMSVDNVFSNLRSISGNTVAKELHLPEKMPNWNKLSDEDKFARCVTTLYLGGEEEKEEAEVDSKSNIRKINVIAVEMTETTL